MDVKPHDRRKKRSTTKIQMQNEWRFGGSSSMFLYVHRDHQDYQGRGAQEGHLDFHAAPELGGPKRAEYTYST